MTRNNFKVRKSHVFERAWQYEEMHAGTNVLRQIKMAAQMLPILIQVCLCTFLIYEFIMRLFYSVILSSAERKLFFLMQVIKTLPKEAC